MSLGRKRITERLGPSKWLEMRHMRAGSKCKALAPPPPGLVCLHVRQEEGASTLFLVGPGPARVPTSHRSLQTGCPPFSESGSIQFLLPWPLRSSSTEVGRSSLPQSKKTYNCTHLGALTSQKLPRIRLEPRAPDTGERVKRPCSASSLLWAGMSPKLCLSKYSTICAAGQEAESVGTCRYVLGLAHESINLGSALRC